MWELVSRRLGVIACPGRQDMARLGTATPLIRLAIGLVQGVALLMLYKASEQKTWPATDGFVFAPLAATATFVLGLPLSHQGDDRGWQ